MLQSFLDKYDTLILDMDGVITSEQRYWDAAALTVYEMLHSKKYFGKDDIDYKSLFQNRTQIRSTVFFDDNIITVLKKKGINSNWDLAYVTLSLALIYGNDTILQEAEDMSDNTLNEYQKISKALAEKLSCDVSYTARSGGFWKSIHNCFQEWYLGNDEKEGLVFLEEPLLSVDSLELLLQELFVSGKRLCIGTGRPQDEILIPLEKWGFKEYFDQNGIITFDEVVNVESKMGKTVTKPHPYVFLKALFGSDYSDDRILSEDYDNFRIKTALVIGDAGADILAAQAMGADFCAVLTGVSGQEARGYFENLNSTYIINSFLDLQH